MKKIFFILFFISLFSTLYSEKIFRILSRGSVKDNSTELVWTRCSLSDDNKPIYDFNCEGTKKKFTWAEGMNACEKLDHEGRKDWRMPSVRELQSILFFYHYSVGYQNASQTIESVFPNVVSTDEATAISTCRQQQLDTVYPDIAPTCSDTQIFYWSSTSHKRDSRFAWFTDFFTGGTAYDWATNKKFVRCVAGP